MRANVTGDTDSPNFPTTPGAYDVTLNTGVGLDAFVTKLNATGTGQTRLTVNSALENTPVSQPVG